MKRLIAIVLLLFSAPAFASWTLGTCASGTISGSTSGSLSITPTAGSLLVFAVLKVGSAGSTISATYPKDSNGTLSAALTYSEVSANSKLNGVGVYYETSTASGAHSISLSFTGTSSWTLLACPYTYAGGTPTLDATSPSITTSSGTSTSILTGNLTPSQTGDLVIALATVGTASITFSGWTNSFVQETTATNTVNTGVYADLQDVSSTSINAGATASSAVNWAAYLVAFKLATTSGPPKSQFFIGW